MGSAQRYPIAYDFSRLASRIFSRTPNGIDRVDMAYAGHFLAEGRGADCGVLFMGPLGMRVVRRERASVAIREIDLHFRETAVDADAVLLRAVSDWTAGRRGEHLSLLASGPRQLRKTWPRIAGYTLRTLAAAGGRAVTKLPENTRYLCASQFPLSELGAFDWLKRRPDVKAVFFIHDLLPLQYPEYFRPNELARHALRIKQLAEVGSAALVSSQIVADVLCDQLKCLGRSDFPVHISPMPVAGGFTPGPVAAELVGASPYFIQCGTIEPRKNHLMILHVWRDLAARLGVNTPKLIIVGARGWENENVLDLLDRSPAIRDHVLELRNVDTVTLVELMRGARALVMPSFAEGFGLPIAEAMAVGLPVIASDIPIFHEVSGGNFRSVHPLDGKGWLYALESAAEREPSSYAYARSRTERRHQGSFTDVRSFINDL